MAQSDTPECPNIDVSCPEPSFTSQSSNKQSSSGIENQGTNSASSVSSTKSNKPQKNRKHWTAEDNEKFLAALLDTLNKVLECDTTNMQKEDVCRKCYEQIKGNKSKILTAMSQILLMKKNSIKDHFNNSFLKCIFRDINNISSEEINELCSSIRFDQPNETIIQLRKKLIDNGYFRHSLKKKRLQKFIDDYLREQSDSVITYPSDQVDNYFSFDSSASSSQQQSNYLPPFTKVGTVNQQSDRYHQNQGAPYPRLQTGDQFTQVFDVTDNQQHRSQLVMSPTTYATCSPVCEYKELPDSSDICE